MRRTRLHRLVLGTAFVAVLLFACASIAAMLTHARVLPVLSGSMAPTIDVNSLVVTRPVDAGQLRVGDVAVYARPGSTDLVMHRVVEIGVVDGARILHTRGDANAADDPWTIDTSRSVIHRVEAAVPHIGRLYRVVHASVQSPTAALSWVGLFVLLSAAAVFSRRRRPTCDDGDPVAAKPSLAAGLDLATAEDLRHRLAAIIGYSEILTEHHDDRPAMDVQMATTVHDHARRLCASLEDLEILTAAGR
ncbi:signal peptidase I [Jidongwangia harbinensis]|uniref:signal peptidase I n=1 Tax=Jidongwangia harbinensis TaxID=2878561 RepID=UPI001CD96FD5|nr:signal peptidase I [Jidongwangia harbinensis]MCA2218381.1 signal peptidase I [Jidongwangia harbinensis]